MARPELGNVIPVNFATKTRESGVTIVVKGEGYRPRELDPRRVSIHEGIHAALAGPGRVKEVSIRPRPGSLGHTILTEPDGVAALGPDSVGADGTQWDVAVAEAQGHSAGSRAAARAAVHENHAVIIEIADWLEKKGELTGAEVDAARESARKKKQFGVSATITAVSEETRESVTVTGVKVEGDQTNIPFVVVDFTERLRLKREEETRRTAEVKGEKEETIEDTPQAEVFDLSTERMKRRPSEVIDNADGKEADVIDLNKKRTRRRRIRKDEPVAAAIVEPAENDDPAHELRVRRLVLVRSELAALEPSA